MKKLGVLTLSTGLTIGVLTPYVSATSLGNEQFNNIQIQVSEVDSVVTKSDLIKKFKEVFPNEFNFLSESDFDMWTGRHFPEDDTIRYDLNFHKSEKGKSIHGNVSFVGEELEIENFYYQPADVTDALFPPKVSKEEAEKVAIAFVNKFAESKGYKLEENLYDYYSSSSQPLTEPVRYSFSFVLEKDNVPVSNQRMHVTVLGNGEVSDFYRNTTSNGTKTYDDLTKVLAKEDVVSKVKENFSVDLQYRVEFDYETNTRDVKLVYQPNSYVVNALSGNWLTVNGFSSELPAKKDIKRIVTQAIQPKQTSITLEEARALAEKILAIDSEDIKLNIQSVDEAKNYYGQDIISVNYMYEYKNGGSGTNLELDKRTGEVISYSDIKNDLLRNHGETKEESEVISKDEALSKAVDYLKEYSPSLLHNYAMPIEEAFVDENRGVYHFSFPRVVNGLIVSGDMISVSVAEDGSLLSLNVNHVDIKNWPSVEKVISKEQATEKFFEKLNLDLYYANEGPEKDNHYNLIYAPVYNESAYDYLDAYTGEWTNLIKSKPQIQSPEWAEKELTHLILSGIINTEKVNTFDGNSKVTKGAAIGVIVKSLSHVFPDYYFGQRVKNQTFNNIQQGHPLYQVVERAVSHGIIEKDGNTFEMDETLTREELAIWYIRTLGLEEAAKNQGIYQLSFDDAQDVTPENVGYVALAHSLGLIPTEDNKFNPKQEVTYADLAVSVVRLAKEAYKKGIQLPY